jgi:hypothetical protein
MRNIWNTSTIAKPIRKKVKSNIRQILFCFDSAPLFPGCCGMLEWRVLLDQLVINFCLIPQYGRHTEIQRRHGTIVPATQGCGN